MAHRNISSNLKNCWNATLYVNQKGEIVLLMQILQETLLLWYDFKMDTYRINTEA